MVISVCNNKGGVGKSAVSVNLSNALGNKGKRCLVVDYDPQGNSSELLLDGVTPQHTLFDVLEGDIPIKEAVTATSFENLHVLANEGGTAAMEMKLYADVRSSYPLLRKILSEIVAYYDFIFLDLPPNLGMFTIQALIASQAVIVPIDASSKHSLQGLNAAIKAIQEISKQFNPDLRFLRAVVNKVDKRTSISKTITEQVRRVWNDQVFQTSIPICADIQKAETASTTVIRYAPHSTGAKRFRALADELLDIIGTEAKIDPTIPMEFNGVER